MDAITVESPAKTAERTALKTLGDIRHYVDVNRFSLSGLTRGLGRKAAPLHIDLEWLVREGYLSRDVSQIYSLTDAGRRYVPSDEDGEQGSFHIIFAAKSDPPPKPPERRR